MCFFVNPSFFIILFKKSFKKKLVKSQHQSRAQLMKLLQWDVKPLSTFMRIFPFLTGVGVDATDHKGLTPLMMACMFGRSLTAAYLLGRGAQPHLTDMNGDRALHWAAYKGYPSLMQMLVYSEFDPQVCVVPVTFCPDATVIKWDILKHPVFNILNFRGWIKRIFDTVY